MAPGIYTLRADQVDEAGKVTSVATAMLKVGDTILVRPGSAIAADGVYAGWLSVVGNGVSGDCALPVRQWPAAISVGTNPTFDDVPERVVEAYALHETDIDLYDHLVAVDFVAKVREMRAFSSLDELISAMNADVATAERILGLS